MKKLIPIALTGLTLSLGLFSCNSTAQDNEATVAEKALYEAYESKFHIGAALNHQQANGQDEKAVELVKSHFNSITPENLLKWGNVHPEPDEFNWEPADNYVQLGEDNDMFVVGHTLVWHQQTPDWVFEDEEGNPADKATLMGRMEEHIEAVAGRYKGKIHGWDVVNEALNDDGTLRESKWYNITGEDYLSRAFELAHEIDPEAELYYNDYNMWKPEKCQGAIKLVQNILDQGIAVHGIGMQGHYGLHTPSLEQIEESILAIDAIGMKVMITELDIDVLPNPSKRQGADIDDTFEFDEQYNPYTDGLPDSIQEQLTQRYAELFELFEKHQDKITRVTFWGVTDQDSWLNNWPIRGRTSYPLIFDRDYQPKPAFEVLAKDND